jgi:mannose-6-phosphate isomerase-like protein (cupin superfamily)
MGGETGAGMHAKSRSAVFMVQHNAWDRVEEIAPAGGASLRRLQGGDSEAWWVELVRGSRVATSGLPAEGVLTVLDGKARCSMFGNELDLPANSFALLPPNTPFVLRPGGRKPALLLAHFNRSLPESLPFEG